eukprot:2975872-Lingulodinium_polyedra.AAC.1
MRSRQQIWGPDSGARVPARRQRADFQPGRSVAQCAHGRRHAEGQAGPTGPRARGLAPHRQARYALPQ